MDKPIEAVDVLDWLNDLQYTLKLSLDRAERKPHVAQGEIDAINKKLAYVDYLIGVMIERL